VIFNLKTLIILLNFKNVMIFKAKQMGNLAGFG